MSEPTYSQRENRYYADGVEIDPLVELIERDAEIERLQGWETYARMMARWFVGQQPKQPKQTGGDDE